MPEVKAHYTLFISEKSMWQLDIQQNVDADKSTLPVSSLQSIIKRRKEQGAVIKKLRISAARKITPSALAKLKRSVKKYTRTLKKKLVEEMASNGVNVIRQTVINAVMYLYCSYSSKCERTVEGKEITVFHLLLY